MEAVELIWALVNGCGCLLDLLAAGSWIGAGSAGLQAQRSRKRLRTAEREWAAVEEPSTALQESEQAKRAAYERSMWIYLGLFVLGLAVAAVLTALTLWKWLR